MDHIREAVERAKKSRPAGQSLQEKPLAGSQVNLAGIAHLTSHPEIMLDPAHLESKRIIAHDIADSRSRSFDMLRTQVLQPMDMKSWHMLGVTSPTAGCGKSVISLNLGFSTARQPDRSVLLVDMDFQRPKIADYLGLRCEHGILSVLEGKTDLRSAVVPARIRDQQLLVLPCEATTLHSSEWMASRQMSTLLKDIRRNFQGYTIILDFPPILAGDDFISSVSQIDCVLFVAAAGLSTKTEIKECNKHLENTSVVRVVVNKSMDSSATYYYSRYGSDSKPSITNR